ncbi:hypothetical protein FIV00_10945 [Labrenzia sp. THAF82]|nr:hypothetical protein FIV00_10945 [Labrenzia sp. THAF82]
MCSLILLSGCATVDDRLRAAATQTAETQATRELPDYPTDCRKKERSGVREGEPLDLALLRTDQALGRANARVQRCGQWYQTVQIGFRGEEID